MDWQHFIARLEHCKKRALLRAATLKNLKAKCVLVALVCGAVSAPVSAQTSSSTVWRSDNWRVWKKDQSCNLSQTNLREGLAENRTNLTIELPVAQGSSGVMVYSPRYPDFAQRDHRVALLFGNGTSFDLNTGERTAEPFDLGMFGHGVALFLDPQSLHQALRSYGQMGIQIDGNLFDRVSLDGIAEGVAELEKCAGRSSLTFADAARPELNTRQMEIMRTVRSVDGYIDKALHDEFWMLMPSALRDSPSAHRMLRDLLAEVGEAREDLQEQTWLSAYESLKAGRVVRTAAYLEAKEASLNASANPGYQARIRDSIASAERLLEAAGSGTPLDVHGGRTYITSDLIEQVLSGIRASEFRFAKLVSPSWDDRPTEFKYPEAHVSILALAPFTLERREIRNPGTRDIEMISLSQTLNPSTYVAVSFAANGGRYSDPVKSLVSNARAGVEGAGATGRPPVFIKWRGFDSATAAGQARTSEGDVYVSVRVAEIPRLNGIIQFIAVSQLSAAEALNQRGILEDSSNILP